MIKKYLWITILIFGFISCEEAPNNFSTQANEFLNAIDGKNYQGVGETWKDHTFEARGTVIAEFGTPPNNPLTFRNTRNNGTSTTEAIYQYNREPRKYVGIIRENGGDILRRTADVDTEGELTAHWATAPEFANIN